MMGFLRPAGSWKRMILAGSLFVSLLYVMAGCEDAVVDPVSPGGVSLTQELIDTVSAPEFWVLGSDEYRDIVLTLNLSDETRAAVRNGDLSPALTYVQIESDQLVQPWLLPLFDDGGAYDQTGLEDFVNVRSGDLIPGDYSYHLRMNTGFASSEGDYTFGFIVDGLNASDMGTPAVIPDPLYTMDITVSANEGPVISEINLPDSLHAGFDVQQWVIEVSDPNEQSGDEVTEVMVSLNGNNLVFRDFLFAPLNPPTWTFTADSTFSAGLPTMEYSYSIVAIDKFEQPSAMALGTIWIENLAPNLIELTAPDTVQQPGPDDPPNVYAFTLELFDSQGENDIESVFYTVVDPTGNFAESPDFVFRDDGEGGDETAGDGLWTHLFQVSNTVSNFGTYTFTFYAEDRAGNVATPIEQEIELTVFAGVPE